MPYVTTTELRTKMPEIIGALLAGESIDLIHRSRLIGEIKPQKYQNKPLTREDIAEIKAAAKKLNLPKLTDKQLLSNYRKHIMEKYGKGIS
ncbi:hypothetical protein HY950_02850 [Candidatus Gottesmanbacteria bacterium]|nr:hypothetical protein [Candidatus Gottesmanbacteria bacterium]